MILNDKQTASIYQFWQALDDALLKIAKGTDLTTLRYLAVHGEPTPMFRETLYAHLAANKEVV